MKISKFVLAGRLLSVCRVVEELAVRDRGYL